MLKLYHTQELKSREGEGGGGNHHHPCAAEDSEKSCAGVTWSFELHSPVVWHPKIKIKSFFYKGNRLRVETAEYLQTRKEMVSHHFRKLEIDRIG